MMSTISQKRELDDLSDREKWILRLLYAPVKNGADKSIEGRTRLVKGLFLIERMFDEEFTEFEGTGFSFLAYKYGPFDQSIYASLERLERDGLIKEESMPEYKGDVIRLTDEDEVLAREAYDELSPKMQKQISWIKERHVQQPVAQLLNFVYNKYPETAKNSEYSA